MKLRDVARVLEEIVRANGQLESLMRHYGHVVDKGPFNGELVCSDWGECWDVAYNYSLDWKAIVELTIYWLLEEKVRLGAYET